VTVGLIGLLGREVAGERAGLVAAGLGAVYPMLWLADAAAMSETTSMLLVTAVLLTAYRARGWRGMALLGALIGLAALARGEAVGLLVLLLVDRRRALAGLAAFVLVLAPWTIRNALTFDAPVLISTNANGVFVGANCDRTYYGDLIGSWAFSCYGDAPPGDEARRMVAYRARGLRYAHEHAGRVPVVVAARVGRLLDVYRPWDQGVFFNGTEGRDPRASRAALVMYWALLPFGIAGTRPINAFFYLATVGVLSLLVMYMVTNAAAMVFLWRAERRWLDVVLPLGGIAVAGYTIYRNVYPAPASPFDVFPWIVLGWLALGTAAALLVPGLAQRLGAQLALRAESS
jgi:hypothetical protein